MLFLFYIGKVLSEGWFSIFKTVVWPFCQFQLHQQTTPFTNIFNLILIKGWLINYIHYKVWDEITNPFPNFNGGAIEVWEWISNFTPPFNGHVITYKAGIQVKPC